MQTDAAMPVQIASCPQPAMNENKMMNNVAMK
jgi:hypothetical protein